MKYSPSSHEDYSWRALRAGEADRAFALHRQVLQSESPGILREDSLDHFTRHIQVQGRIVACFKHDRLVAYGVLGLESQRLQYMGELLNIDPKHQMRLCLLDGAACELGSRGCGLHTQAITLRIVMARQLGKNLVAATVSPTNLISLRGLFRQGFIIQKYAEVYGGLPRLLLVRDLQTQSHAWQHILVVANTDFQGHCAALQLGLSGYGCIQDHDHSWLISYGMRAAS